MKQMKMAIPMEKFGNGNNKIENINYFLLVHYYLLTYRILFLSLIISL